MRVLLVGVPISGAYLLQLTVALFYEFGLTESSHCPWCMWGMGATVVNRV